MIVTNRKVTDMNVKGMLYIATIAETKSLSGAAQLLGISQPTLSVFLSNLETSLGLDLFLREKKQLVLTPAGKIYLDAAHRILNVKDQTYQSIHRLTHHLTQTIVVGVTPLRGAIMVAQIFPEFCRRFPDVKIEIRESYMNDLRKFVKSGEISFALGSGYDSENPDYDFLMISEEEILLGVPSFHRLAALVSPQAGRFPDADIRDFWDSPFVLMAPGTTVRSISDNICSKADFHPTVVFETNNNLVLSNMIRQGAGVGFLPRSSMVEGAGDIVYFSLRPKYYLGLGIITARNRPLTQPERYLAYLVIKRDKDNPLYRPALNAYAKSIFREFEHGEHSL